MNEIPKMLLSRPFLYLVVSVVIVEPTILLCEDSLWPYAVELVEMALIDWLEHSSAMLSCSPEAKGIVFSLKE